MAADRAVQILFRYIERHTRFRGSVRLAQLWLRELVLHIVHKVSRVRDPLVRLEVLDCRHRTLLVDLEQPAGTFESKIAPHSNIKVFYAILATHQSGLCAKSM